MTEWTERQPPDTDGVIGCWRLHRPGQLQQLRGALREAIAAPATLSHPDSPRTTSCCCKWPPSASARPSRSVRTSTTTAQALALQRSLVPPRLPAVAGLSPDRGTVRLSSAGHFRPVYAPLGEPAALVEMPVDAPLGLGRNLQPRRTTVIDLPPGALLLGYTYGLVERRHQVIDVGIKGLLEAVRPDPPETVCDTVLSQMAFEKPDDDIAVLAIRRL